MLPPGKLPKRQAYKAVANIVAEGGTILFVGTKKQAQDAIKAEAELLITAIRLLYYHKNYALASPTGFFLAKFG